MSYIKEKLIPGYTGKFVISQHAATHLHWDLRLEFPVDSISKSLADYSGKRPKKGVEPTPATPNKPGTVLRSWAVPKHSLPSSKPLLATQTEDHAIQYLGFHGIIPSGYGAGTVKIIDKGTYTLDKVDYDKKYVFTLHGNKIKGTFALIKTGGKSFLWLKTKNKKACVSTEIRRIASIIDYVRPTLAPQIFSMDEELPVMRDKVRQCVINTLIETFEKSDLKNPLKWIKSLYLSGSMASYNYTETSDFDTNIYFDKEKLKEIHPEFNKLKDEDLIAHVRDVIYGINGKRIPETSHTISYMVVEKENFSVSDGVYDILNNKWLKGPVKIPENFDPDRAFILQRKIAEKVAKEIDLIIGSILRTVDTLEVIDKYNRIYENQSFKRIALMQHLRMLCEALNKWYERIYSLRDRAINLEDPVFPAFNFSSSWEEKMIIFKYLCRYGYNRCIYNLYKLLKNSPYLKVIDQFIPD